MSTRVVASWLIVALTLAVGCGGKVFVDRETSREGAGGTAGGLPSSTSATGQGGFATSSVTTTPAHDAGGVSSTVSGGGGCPGEAPAQGEMCPSEGQQCTYGACCPTVVATCAGAVWQVVPGECPQPACPPGPPADGSACSCHEDGLSCTYDICSFREPLGVFDATCSGGTWHVDEAPCDTCATHQCPAGVPPCGAPQDDPCSVGFYCVTCCCTPVPDG